MEDRKVTRYVNNEKKVRYEHMVDALACVADEGRVSWRYASGSEQERFDPGISEWGNPLLYAVQYGASPY